MVAELSREGTFASQRTLSCVGSTLRIVSASTQDLAVASRVGEFHVLLVCAVFGHSIFLLHQLGIQRCEVSRGLSIMTLGGS